MQDAVIKFLKSAAGHPGGKSAEIVHTHGAIIFLAGDVALKMKRDVRFDYMDLSTLELRETMLRRELALNKPSAPEIYQDVLPVNRAPDGTLAINGVGPPVEWVLKMWRFPADAELAVIAETRGVSDALAQQLGRAISDYHDQNPRRNDDGKTLIKDILDELDRVFSTMPAELGSDLIDQFHRATRAALTRLSDPLRQRGKEGSIRRCHGDLHLRNLVLLDGKVVLFDALEFDEVLGTCDLLYDLAFLLIDLRHRGFHRAANIALNTYLLSQSGRQDTGVVALPLFLAVRAAINAMVLVQTLRVTHQHTGREPIALLKESVEYLSPFVVSLVLVGGYSGTGKTTVATAIAPLIGAAPGAVHLRSDLERKAMHGVSEETHLDGDAYDPSRRDAVYDHVFSRASALLGSGHSVLIDATFIDPDHRSRAMDIARQANAFMQTIWLDAPVSALIDRVTNRHGDASDADENVVLKQIAADTAPDDWQVVSAAGDIEDTIALAQTQLNLATVR